MPKNRSWTDEQLREAVKVSKSYRAVLMKLRLVPAGGNYDQVKRAVVALKISTEHFTGRSWNRGLSYELANKVPLKELLVLNSQAQSHKLKKRLFNAGVKKPQCELCGWSKRAPDGRIPIELDHINGNHYDNRLENLRILCPNCHSLQPTHRGKNKGVKFARVVE